jgi:hypothetical protein
LDAGEVREAPASRRPDRTDGGRTSTRRREEEMDPEDAKALSLGRLLEDLEASQERLTAALDGPAPGPVEEAVGASGRTGVPFFHFHEAYHVGQIGLARRCLGLPGVIEPSDASRV